MLPQPLIVASWKTYSKNLTDDAGFVGGKACGVFRLPRDWVPPFIILTRAFFEQWTEKPNAVTIFANLGTAEQTLLAELLDRIVPSFTGGGARVVVRSNSAVENLAARGSFESYPATPTRKRVANAVDQLLASSRGEVMCAMVQVGIEPGIAGHMSNERRVSHHKNLWLVEELAQGGQEVEQEMIRARQHDVAAPLLASNAAELRDVLRQTAGFLADVGSGRFHCEWVWNGRQVWIVQADEAELSPPNPIVTSYLESIDASAPGFTPESCLCHFRDAPSDKWQKLRRPRLFQKLGIPYADIFLLPGERWTKCDLFDRSALERDFNSMCHYPVVVRCDIAASAAIGETLLPTSAPLTDPRALVSFLDRVSRQLDGLGLSASDWAFLLAFFVPARASAMVHARPRAQRVQVDAIWGLPDGLLHFPHDRWFYYPESGKSKGTRRYKSHCLLPSQSNWETFELTHRSTGIRS